MPIYLRKFYVKELVAQKESEQKQIKKENDSIRAKSRVKRSSRFPKSPKSRFTR
jgi:hypothetical protein|tara:strand:+ start:1471 stop:1632 length:162 start_codon:yes stop_codon:yes gene_type:complete